MQTYYCAPYLYLSRYPSAVHPTCYVDSVSPDVILRPPRPNYSRHHRAHVNPCESIILNMKWGYNAVHQGSVWATNSKARTHQLLRQTHCTTDSWFHPRRQTSRWRSQLWCSDGRTQTSWPEYWKQIRHLNSLVIILLCKRKHRNKENKKPPPWYQW